MLKNDLLQILGILNFLSNLTERGVKNGGYNDIICVQSKYHNMNLQVRNVITVRKYDN